VGLQLLVHKLVMLGVQPVITQGLVRHALRENM